MSDKPWYQAGLRFQCLGCGRCCTGEPGYVYVTQSEIEALAALLPVEVPKFEETFVRPVGTRRSLVERPNGDCVFFDDLSRRCRVYGARPRQCRSWPFWVSNLRTPQAWADTCRACPGSGRGPLIPADQIEALATLVKV